MENKTKIKALACILGAVVLVILVNYALSEFISIHGNFIKKVYIRDVLVKAEVVSSPAKTELGFGGRPNLPAGRGMLFTMSANESQRFWMKGMRFGIDIIWIENGRVTGCEKNISPEDQRIFTSPGNAGSVLEVPQGFCDANHVEVNDAVTL